MQWHGQIRDSYSEEFSLHKELGSQIKSSLLSQRRTNPDIKIEMSFDKDLYNEGLRSAGFVKCIKRGIEHCTIRKYNDLDGLLGARWHYRGLNEAGDFCYIIENTIDFYLRKKRQLVQYIPTKDGTPIRVSISTGYTLVFKFVHGDGTGAQFEKLDDVFR